MTDTSTESPQQTLVHQQKVGEHNISIYDQGNLRSLYFDSGAIQTQIDLQNPGKLPLAVYRAMLAPLMFIDEPNSVLLLGTGGGAIARYLHHHIPDLKGVAVEKSAEVADIAGEYFSFPSDKSNWELIVDDARNFTEQYNNQFDYIVVDITENDTTPVWIYNISYLKQLKALLTPNGVLVINIVTDDPDVFTTMAFNARDQFKNTTAFMSVPDHRNILLFGFMQQPPYCNDNSISSRLPDLEKQWSIEFGEFYSRMQVDNPPESGIF